MLLIWIICITSYQLLSPYTTRSLLNVDHSVEDIGNVGE